MSFGLVFYAMRHRSALCFRPRDGREWGVVENVVGFEPWEMFVTLYYFVRIPFKGNMTAPSGRTETSSRRRTRVPDFAKFIQLRAGFD